MAIDTRDKRASCLGIDGPYRFVLPDPDVGAEGEADRRQMAYTYPGFAGGGGGPAATPDWLTSIARRRRGR